MHCTLHIHTPATTTIISHNLSPIWPHSSDSRTTVDEIRRLQDRFSTKSIHAGSYLLLLLLLIGSSTGRIISLLLCGITLCCHSSHGTCSLRLSHSIGCGTGWLLSLGRGGRLWPVSLFNGCCCSCSTKKMNQYKFKTEWKFPLQRNHTGLSPT